MTLFDDDLSFIAGDVFSSPVVFGSQSTRGILSVNDTARSDAGGMGGETRVTTLELPASALTGLVIGTSTLTVAGVSYLVENSDPSIDGRSVVLSLAKVI